MAGVGFRRTISNNGVRTLLPGAPGSQPSAEAVPFLYETAQIEEVIVNETSDNAGTTDATSNIGRIRFRPVNTNKGVSSKLLDYADPLIPYQSQYPLVGEYVLVFKLQVPREGSAVEMNGKYFYIGPIAAKRKLTENRFPLVASTLRPPVSRILRNQRTAAAGVTTRAAESVQNLISPSNFKEAKINPIKPFEGDIIYQGRYGQSIRFGSSQMQGSFNDPHPNIILRAGQGPDTARTLDDRGARSLTNDSINTDASAIWMVSNQLLGIIPATFGTNIHLASTFETPIFSGASILLNSDKLIFNSKETSIYLFAKKGIHLNALQDGVTVDTAGPIVLNTPDNIDIFSQQTLSVESREDIIISARKDVNISGDRNIVVFGNEIFLGGRGLRASPITLASPLKLFFWELLRVVMTTQPLVIGPTGVVNPAFIARLLVVFLKNIVLPDPFNPSWASNDNFAMKTNERTMASDLPAKRSFKRVGGLGNKASDGVDAVTSGERIADNAGSRDLRRLYNREVSSRL